MADGTRARRERLSQELRRLDPFRPAGRKTHRTVTNRRKTHELPDFTVSMILPEGKSVAPGETFGIICLTVQVVGSTQHVIVTAKSKDFAIDQAKTFLRRMDIPRLQAVVRRADEPGPTLSGPIRKGYERALWIEAKGDTYLERGKGGLTMRTLMLPLFGQR
jgi:hypothetical protein